MSADHRKPVVAFVVLAFLAAALVGVQRADAQSGHLLAVVLGDRSVVVQGNLGRATVAAGRPEATSLPEALSLGGRRTSTYSPAPDSVLRSGEAQTSRGEDRPAREETGREPSKGRSAPSRRPAEHAAQKVREAVPPGVRRHADAAPRGLAPHGGHDARVADHGR